MPLLRSFEPYGTLNYKNWMDEKSLHTLEYPKILERLAGYCAFAVSVEKARALRPTADIEDAQRWQAETSEALELLHSRSSLTIGGARDIREAVDLAAHGGVLTSQDLLDIKSTLISARNLGRGFERSSDQYPSLCDIATQFPPPLGLIDAITRAISDRGEVLDTASERLGNIRRDLHITRDRLLDKMQRIANDPKNAPLLQESLVTQRDGRYVLPLRAEFKGRIRSVVHDQSSSGATLFVEPLSVVEMNNTYRELQLAERDEERRILTDLSNQVGAHAGEIELALEVIAELDVVFSKAKYAADLRAARPRLHPFEKPKGKYPGCTLRLYQARHPLLSAETVVPIDVELDPQTYALVITGPNTGGKTVTLKTIGLLALMAQSGLHIPAQSGSEISIFEDVLADIGDEQSIEQSLSTFSSHITNIIRILERADRRSLVILDELGAGTDPQEGAALAQALLGHLLERGIITLVATHYPELKAYAHARPGVANASVEFDLETLQPTFHLTIGLPGRSNALAIAQRLGLPEDIVALARAGINPEDLRAEDLLDEIHRQRELAYAARQNAEKARGEAEEVRNELSERLDEIEDERRQILEGARGEAQAQIEALQSEIQDVRRALMRARQPAAALEQVEEIVADLEEAVEEPVERRRPEVGEDVLQRPVRLGDQVRLRSLNSRGVVTSLDEEEAEVQVGQMRVRTRLAELELIGTSPDQPEQTKAQRRRETTEVPQERRSASAFAPQSPGIELDLRGQRADEALESLDRYLDAAFLAGLPFVRIIHGKGTGKLRQAVREALPQNPHVKSFEPGRQQEGGDGVTVARLAG
jgi:DNA mismatch repair protein MutS2